MRHFVVLSLFILFTFQIKAQSRKPFIFRMQEKRVNKQIHHYLRYDTLLKTNKAVIHLNYSTAPGKPYLLLLHGMGVDAKTNWYKQISELSRYYNLIMPDLIYFGQSSTTEANYSVEFQAEQIHEAIDLLKIFTKLNVMGFSYGGLTAAMYNQLYYKEVLKLIIMDGPVKFYSTHMADSMALLAGVGSMSNIIIPQNTHEFNAMEKAVISKHMAISNRFKKRIIANYFTPTLTTRQLQIYYLTAHEIAYTNYSYHLGETPTLLVWGGRDGVVPPAVGEALHAAFPKSTQLLIFPKAKHDVHFREAKKLNKTVVNFLNK